jgi:hypothetical protein
MYSVEAPLFEAEIGFFDPGTRTDLTDGPDTLGTDLTLWEKHKRVEVVKTSC